jgi:hypothetical protein
VRQSCDDRLAFIAKSYIQRHEIHRNPAFAYYIRVWLTRILDGTASADLRHLFLEPRELRFCTGEKRIHIRRV